MKDIDDLESISYNLIQLSNCGLGQTSGTPIHDTLKYFRAEVGVHILLKVFPAGDLFHEWIYSRNINSNLEKERFSYGQLNH